MKILVINCGSSSLKYQVFNINEQYELLAKGLVERIGLKGSLITHKPVGKDSVTIEKDLPDHKAAMENIEPILTNPAYGVLKDISEINGVGHRVLHGAEIFKSSVVIDEENLKQIKSLVKFGPLHMPANIIGIETCQQILPGVPNVAVFDTAIHQSMPPKAFMYGISTDYYKKDGIRRYGFHGTSHEYVSLEAAKILAKDLKDIKLITCHIGNGSSITAFADGKVIDTSMGLTPLEGLIMGTRCGDIDPAAVLTIMDHYNISPKDMDNLLNKQSGLKGLTGKSDMRDVLKLANEGDQTALMTIEMFVYRIQKYIGSYTAALKGVDAIVFTAGIGENNAYLREKILSAFEYLGLKLDLAKNNNNETFLSTQDSKVKALLISTNEELMIAQDTSNLI